MIIASLIYIRKNGKTLMVHRNKKEHDYHEGKYNGIGGKLELGESPEECGVREIYEETGLVANHLIYRGHITFPVFDGNDDWLCFIYECYDFEGVLGVCKEGTLHWVDDDKLLSLNLWEGDQHFIKIIYETDKQFSGKFIYDNKKLKTYTIYAY